MRTSQDAEVDRLTTPPRHDQYMECGFLDSKTRCEAVAVVAGIWQEEDKLGWGILETMVLNFMDPLRI